MDRQVMARADGDALHRRVAERAALEPGIGSAADWRTVRDLALIVTATTAGPLALFALKVGAVPAAVWGLSAAATAALVAVFPALGGAPTMKPTRWGKVALRLIPARHGRSSVRSGRRLAVRRSNANTPETGAGS